MLSPLWQPSGGGGNATPYPAVVAGSFPTGSEATVAPFSRSGTLSGLSVYGDPGSLELRYVTATQYAADKNAAGTSIGTVSLTSGTQKASALTRTVTKGDFLRVVPTVTSGVLSLYGEVA